MRRHYGWWSLAILWGLCGPVAHAADPGPLAARFTPADRGQPPATSGDRVKPPAAPAAQQPASPVAPVQPPSPTFAERLQSAQQLQQRQQQIEDNRPKPTSWELQNPANPQNNYPTEMIGPAGTNTYFGARFHQWSNLSAASSMPQLPANQTMVPAVNQTNLYTAPNNYYGNRFSNWSNIRNGEFERNPFGGWNYR